MSSKTALWPKVEKAKLNSFISALVSKNETVILRSLGKKCEREITEINCLNEEVRDQVDVFSIWSKSDESCKDDIWKTAFRCTAEKLKNSTALDEVLGEPGKTYPDETHEGCISVLGTYHRINSPGVITLYGANLQSFALQLSIDLYLKDGCVMTRENFKTIHKIVVAKTVFHELFHHLSDMTHRMRITGNTKSTKLHGHYEYLREEALAVAISRWHIGNKENATNLIENLLKRAYDYSLPGYRDWVKFKGDFTLWSEVLDYFDYDKRLLQNRNGSSNEAVRQLTIATWIQICERPFVMFDYR